MIVDLKERAAEVAAAAAAGYYSVAAVVAAAIEPFLSKENNRFLEKRDHEVYSVF